ncbi:hypothetical protein AT15_07555 [Kosmotoga arenicorallina S304]|uniref:Alginate export domain-containing protein n=1 Tax=Kosmotoga arenicorallina S304 TaxID=1453497 RepID=A0A182C7Q3_9BACT|nr:capsule assembly Wzi family protein [Kosmotoga arenicorallina]OAA31344.1 hypothetical protein AT15_07555 [Kosmotoga arenicorallina S304]
MKSIWLLLVILVPIVALANIANLNFKADDSYIVWKAELLLNKEVPAVPNTPISSAFMGEPEQFTSNTTASFTTTPQLTLHNFEPFTTRKGWYNPCVPLYLRYRYDTLQPWAILRFDSDISSNAKAVINLDFKKDYRSYISHGPSGNATPLANLPVELLKGDVRALDFSFPSFGYAAYATGEFQASLGRYKLSWGPMRNGLTISNASNYYDNFSSSYVTPMGKSGNFSYTFNMISVIPLLSGGEWERQRKVSVGSPHYWDLNQDQVYDEPSKLIVGHRFDIKLNKRLRIGVGEINVVGGKHPDLTDFNPFIVFHNTYGEGFSNVMMSLDFSLVPFKGFQIYGEFAMDDYSGPTEAGARGKPAAMAYGLGAEYFLESTRGIYHFSAEAYHTDTWMYNRWQPLLKITNRTITKSELPGARDANEYPLGFKYGPDLNAFSLLMQWFGNSISASVEFEHFTQGEVTLDTPYLNMDEPSDEPGEFTDPEYWRGPVGELKKANILTVKLEGTLCGFRIGSDFSLYFGSYFEQYTTRKVTFELRPFIEIVF